MAGEVGHVVYAARLVPWLGEKVGDASFWAGTLFPDIRHLGIVSRYHTHPKNVGLQSIVGKDDFHTGMRAHAWIDATREQFMRSKNIKEILPWHIFVPHALKLAEDEIIYGRFEDWNLIHRSLNKVYDQELYYVHSKEHVCSWHTTLQDYLAKKPNDTSRKKLAVAIGLTPASADELNSVVAMLLNNKKTLTLLGEFHDYLETLLQ